MMPRSENGEQMHPGSSESILKDRNQPSALPYALEKTGQICSGDAPDKSGLYLSPAFTSSCHIFNMFHVLIVSISFWFSH